MGSVGNDFVTIRTADDDGQLVPDVRVGEWSMPWNARDGVGRLGPGIPKSDFWASSKEGIDQVGCVYTAQGLPRNTRALVD
jgi:hypothetical protein